MYDEFDEIRPYHDEELPEVYEELIADPAFRQVASAAFPSVPFEMLAPFPVCLLKCLLPKCAVARPSWSSKKLLDMP